MELILIPITRQVFCMSLRLRSKHNIILEILHLATEPRAKTRIMYGANLCYAQIRYYLDFMAVRGMIRETQDGKWIVTEKGRKLLDLYDEAERILCS